MLRIYFASKLRHAAKWRKLCAESSDFIAHARWLKHNTLGTADTSENAREFWGQDEQDVRDADVVIVYAEAQDHLRGALVEAGIAVASGVPVIVVGDHADYGTWQYHAGVRRVGTIHQAIELAITTVRPRYMK